MDKVKLRGALENGTIEWRKHALERMLQCSIGRADVKKVLEFGEIIESYEDDMPHGSALFLYIDTNLFT